MPKYVESVRVSCSFLSSSFATRYVRRNFIGPTEKSLPLSFHKKNISLLLTPESKVSQTLQPTAEMPRSKPRKQP